MPISTKDKIIEVSIDLISKNGYAETSIRDIAKNAGIKTSSIYYHFESKEAILNHILDLFASMISENDNLSKWYTEKDFIITDESAISAKQIMGYLFFEFDDQHRVEYKKVIKILCSEAVRNHEVRNYLRDHNIDFSFKYIKSVLDTLLEAGKISECNTAKLAGLLYSIVFSFMHLDSMDIQYISENHPEDTDMFSLLEYALKPVVEGAYE